MSIEERVDDGKLHVLRRAVQALKSFGQSA